MTSSHDIENRLRNLCVPVVVPSGFKDELRSELRRRGERRKRTRSAMTSVAVVIVFISVMMQESPLESTNSEFGFVERVDDVVLMKRYKDSKAGMTIGRGSTIDGHYIPDSYSDAEALDQQRKLEAIATFHAAGLTRLMRLSGFTLSGRRYLNATYVATIDSVPVFMPVTIDNYTVPPVHRDQYLEFMYTRMSSLYVAHMEHELTRIEPAEVEIDGILWPVERSMYNDPVYGEIIIWWSTYPESS